jgi:hypothetical protein
MTAEKNRSIWTVDFTEQSATQSRRCEGIWNAEKERVFVEGMYISLLPLRRAIDSRCSVLTQELQGYDIMADRATSLSHHQTRVLSGIRSKSNSHVGEVTINMHTGFNGET